MQISDLIDSVRKSKRKLKCAFRRQDAWVVSFTLDEKTEWHESDGHLDIVTDRTVVSIRASEIQRVEQQGDHELAYRIRLREPADTYLEIYPDDYPGRPRTYAAISETR